MLKVCNMTNPALRIAAHPVITCRRKGGHLLGGFGQALKGGKMLGDERIITVCSKCFQASCWQGKFMCQEAQNAGTVDVPVWVLEKLNLEHPDNWENED